MENNIKNCTYDTSSEKELIKMWEDIKGGNTQSLNRNLMKAISKSEEEEKVGEILPYSKRMLDTEKCEWVPFDMWGAHFFVNYRKEELVVQMYVPAPYQPEFGPTLWFWKKIDTTYLSDKLREKEDVYKGYQMYLDDLKKYSSSEGQREIIRQDIQEYKNEGRYDEISGYHKRGGCL